VPALLKEVLPKLIVLLRLPGVLALPNGNLELPKTLD
jgi:hypothetical protein